MSCQQNAGQNHGKMKEETDKNHSKLIYFYIIKVRDTRMEVLEGF